MELTLPVLELAGLVASDEFVLEVFAFGPGEVDIAALRLLALRVRLRHLLRPCNLFLLLRHATWRPLFVIVRSEREARGLLIERTAWQSYERGPQIDPRKLSSVHAIETGIQPQAAIQSLSDVRRLRRVYMHALWFLAARVGGRMQRALEKRNPYCA